jgi:hypothetical protein
MGADLQYFMALGLLVDGRFDLAMSIVEHCIFEIKYYNKVLNGNRSYVSFPRKITLTGVPRPFATAVSHRSRCADLQPAPPG